MAQMSSWLRPGSSARKALLVLHVVSSVALLGEVWGLVVLNLTATLTDDAGLARAAYQLMGRLIFAGGIPLSLSGLATGVVLALTSRWGLLRHYWVFTKFVLLIGVIVIGMFLFDPAGLAAASPDGPAVADQWKAVAAVGSQVVMLVTATTLSVFKPRRRTPLGRRTLVNRPSPANGGSSRPGAPT